MNDEKTMEISQRRVFTRIPFDADYRLQDTDANHNWQGRVVDLSLKGSLVERPPALEPKIGQEYILELLLGVDSLKVVMLVKVAHFDDKHIGFHCMHIDLESISHLRKILELNLGQPELVEREITEMLKLANG